MSRRTDKVEELIRQELARAIQSELGEKYGIVSINRVFVASDLKTATVFVSVIDPSVIDKLIKELNSQRIHFQEIIGKKLTMRFTPHLDFKPDTGSEAVDKVEELLEKIDHGA